MVVGVVSCCRGRSWRGRRWFPAVAFAVVVVFAAVVGVAAAGRPIRVRPAASHVRRLDSTSLMLTRTSAWPAASGGDDDAAPAAVIRRQLIGPGSSPPTCRARCGWCTPCRPVHVAIQPGVGAQWEYYPEVWRCKCGNKLFMP